MAHEQISRIQVRRGPLVDLSGITLHGGEFGWAFDERRLFIGNRELEGAPIDENIEILTEYSSIPYEYISGTTTSRTSTERLRDRVSVYDFGLTDSDSSATKCSVIQEAADYLYNPLFVTTTPHSGAALLIPAATHEIDQANYTTDGSTSNSGIRLYPDMHLIGEGPTNTVITASTATPILETANNTGGTGANLITATGDIVVENIGFEYTSGAGSPLVSLKNSNNVWFINCKFTGTGSTAAAIAYTRDTITSDMGKTFFINCEFDGFTEIMNISDTNTTDGIYFHNCLFANCNAGMVVGDGIANCHVTHSKFDTITGAAYSIQSTNNTGHLSAHNYYLSCGTGISFNASSYENVSLMDRFDTVTTNVLWNDAIRNIVFGPNENYGMGTGAPTQVSFGTTGADTTFLTVPHATLNAFEFDYSLEQNSIKRRGRFRVITDGTNISYDDDFIETGGSTTLTLKAIVSGANVEIQYNATTNTAVFNYQLKSWLD